MSAEPAFMLQKDFAALIGLSRARVGQMVRQEGMPYDAKRGVPVAEARAWIAANKRPYARSSDTEARIAARTERERHDAELARLKVEERSGRLIEREAVRRMAYERARFERDAHLGFAARVAPLIAADTGADAGAVFALLDREMRAHLVALAETSMPARTP